MDRRILQEDPNRTTESAESGCARLDNKMAGHNGPRFFHPRSHAPCPRQDTNRFVLGNAFSTTMPTERNPDRSPFVANAPRGGTTASAVVDPNRQTESTFANHSYPSGLLPTKA